MVLTDRDKFLGTIIFAQDAAENMSFRATTRNFNRGLENSELTSTSASSGWSRREDERLKEFTDTTKIPKEYQVMRGGKDGRGLDKTCKRISESISIRSSITQK